MDFDLRGKTVFVSSGAHGIGQVTADLLTQEGASVIVADVDEEALQQNGKNWYGTFAADLSTGEGMMGAIKFVFDTFGGTPDILINNLGVGDTAPFETLTDERWLRGFNINLMGCVRACRAIVPKMAERGSGCVVNTGSDLAKQPEPGFSDYGAFKAGILYLTKSLAKQFAPKVRVNIVSPGPIWSRMWTRPGGIADQLMEQYGVDLDTAVKRFTQERQMPMGIGQPVDVAHAVVFLASPLAKMITGASIDICGTIRGIL
jgi:NAD(P)-dependent dehydrogenase (short-subunit alcohol dehydrogenase family)